MRQPGACAHERTETPRLSEAPLQHLCRDRSAVAAAARSIQVHMFSMADCSSCIAPLPLPWNHLAIIPSYRLVVFFTGHGVNLR
jgi:hypothetical protein